MDLTGANFEASDLSIAHLGYSTLTNANLTGAVVRGADFSRSWNGVGTGITEQQLYSTASYQEKNLQGIRLLDSDLTGWDFSAQNLTDANLNSSTLTNANLSGAHLTSAS